MSSKMSSTNDLHQAIINQDVKAIKRILEEEAGWKPMDNEGETVLHLAFKCKYLIVLRQESIVKTLECLLNEGLSINLKNAAGRTILFLAIENQLHRVTDFLVQHGANVNTRDQDGNSIVHLIIEERSKNYFNYGHIFQEFIEQDDIDTMTWLLSTGVNVHLRNNDGKTAFNLAIQQNLKHILPTLIKHMNDVNYIVEDGNTIVKSLFISGIMNTEYDVEIIDSLLAFVDHVDKKGSTLVHTFLGWCRGNSGIIQRVLQRFTNVNAQDQDGNTALHLVINNDFYRWQRDQEHTINAVRTLLSKGTNVNLKNQNGDSPVRLAVRVQNLEVLKVLLEYGADVHPSTHLGAHLLHNVSNVRIEDHLWAPIVDTLVHAGWNVNAMREDDQLTPLMEACRAKNPAVAQKLIDNGANVNYYEKRNLMRPIHLAAMARCRKQSEDTEALIKMLTKAGAMVNVRNRRGETALHLVVHCDYKAVETLLKLGAQVDARDEEGRSPLQEATDKRSVGAIKALLRFGADINDTRVLSELNKLAGVEHVNDEFQRGYRRFVSQHLTVDKRAIVVCLAKHWLKLKAANLPAIDGYSYFTNEKSLQKFYIECLREVETLKTYNLNDRMKLFDLLRMDVHSKYASMANEKLKQFLKSPLLKTNYPKYYSCLAACYNKAVTRKILIKHAHRAWDYLTGIRLPDCVEHILAYLDNEDLRVMARAASPKEKRLLQ